MHHTKGSGAKAKITLQGNSFLRYSLQKVCRRISQKNTLAQKTPIAKPNGERIERDIGGALYRVGEYGGHATVIFGEEGDQSILGVTALEALGFQVGPVSGQLKLIELLLL